MARSAHLITFLAALLMLTGCATKRTTTTTDTASIAIRVDTLRDSIFRTDSIYVLDSVFVMAKNDTIIKERWRTQIQYRDRWHDRWHEVATTDTITKVVTEQKVIEKKLSKWQQLQMWCGRILLLIAAGIAAIIAVKLIKHKL
jgi:uncharacterized protein YcfL